LGVNEKLQKVSGTEKDNNIEGLYTANVNDFKAFDFLKIVNPLDC